MNSTEDSSLYDTPMARFICKKYKELGLSRSQAAERAGMSGGYLTGMMAGRIYSPSRDCIQRIADGWGFDVKEYYEAVGAIG